MNPTLQRIATRTPAEAEALHARWLDQMSDPNVTAAALAEADRVVASQPRPTIPPPNNYRRTPSR